MKTKSNINIVASICLLAVMGGAQAASPTITKYLDQLPMPSRLTGSNMTITALEFPQQVLSSDFKPADPSYDGKTLVWGYNGTYPGPTLDVKRGETTTVNWVNNLGNATLYNNVFSVDQTLDWANPPPIVSPLSTFIAYTGSVPIVTHLHGGMVSSNSDGHPEDWFRPTESKKYKYLNDQEAATLWYHDHTMGVTRINVHAGLAGFYLLRDDFEKSLKLAGNSKDDPKYEREIVIQDKSFDENGQLVFPSDGVNPTVHPFWIPEFFGDTIVVNGKTWPRFDVEPRRYRLRMANGSNARFYKLSFDNGLPFWQIGTDAGLLDKPVKVSELTLAPGERADVIVDFSSVVGSEFILRNTGKAPYPNGDPVDAETTGQIMKFIVGTSVTVADQTFNPAKLPTPSLRPNNPIVRLPKVESDRARTRTMTLNEVQGAGGPLKVLVDGKEFNAPITETPKEGATEIWEIINLTADTHPMHLHLVAFQLLSRQKFDVVKYQSAYNKKNPVIPALFTTNPKVSPYLMGKSLPPDANENGWKDTIRMNPGEVTRIAVRFAPTDTPANDFNAQFPFDPSKGPGYVWHCHIIDHEDNEMMRPYNVIRAKK